MLSTIPPEILSHIALHLSLQTSNPPRPPLSLLLTNKSIYRSLCPGENPNLYARLYKSSFDTAAVDRRLAGSHQDLKARGLCDELERRVRALTRLTGLTRKGDVRAVSERDLWVVYLMLLENDGRNLPHLLNHHGLFLPRFLELYQTQCLLPPAIQPGYPEETVEKSLAMWIYWLVMGLGNNLVEPPDHREERLFLLRPYVFASQIYEMYFGPWTYPDLPFSISLISSTSRSTNRPMGSTENNPFIADLTPKSRLVTIDYFGTKLDICPPMLSLAAILLFFVRPSRSFLPSRSRPLVDHPVSYVNVNLNGIIIPQAVGQSNQNIVPSIAMGRNVDQQQEDEDDDDLSTDLDMDQDDSDLDTDTEFDLTPSRFMPITNSRIHDRDFKRLVNCYNPLSSRGMSTRDWKQSFTGSWEGTFSFFDFDAFRDMVAGQTQALYTGPYGEQAQVWKLTETFVRKKKVKRDNSSGSGFGFMTRTETRQSSRVGISETQSGQAMEIETNFGDMEIRSQNQGGEHGKDHDDDQDQDVASNQNPTQTQSQPQPKGLPLNGPSTNAGFPTDLPSPTSAGLESAAAEAYTLRETIAQQVASIEGYEIVPDDELDQELGIMTASRDDEEDDGGRQPRDYHRYSGEDGDGDGMTAGEHNDGVEMLLTGTGHSAWGRFILKGRVRVWDGMATLVKEYSPNARGKWIYRGYVLAGGLFVGRWRDTFTPDAYVGYEGTFILNRRR